MLRNGYDHFLVGTQLRDRKLVLVVVTRNSVGRKEISAVVVVPIMAFKDNELEEDLYYKVIT